MAPLAPPLPRALVLIGFMGAGKSRAAHELARALGGRALDSDRLLEERFGHTIAHEFELHGEAAFRAHEQELVCELLADAAPGTVLALGGGSVLSERVRAALAAHLTVLLDVDVDVAWGRVRKAAADALASSDAGAAAAVTAAAGGGEQPSLPRPLARDRAAFGELYERRRPLYEELADAILPAVGDAAPRALGALRALAAAPRGTRLLWARAATGEYPVLVGAGLMSGGGWSDELWPLDRSDSRSFCVCDETVAELAAKPGDAVHKLITIPPGEQHKTLATAERVWRALAEAGMTRADHLVAFGGGVVGDLAGFCAATYQRGVPVVQVPTTLVAQVDSAYGGKTGVDLPEAKNYVGAYHQPAGVMVDPDLLRTLIPAERNSGWVEVLKTALLAGGELWRRLAAAEPVDERTILAGARTKLDVVARDERDGGARQALNLGHTVGHAIETATGYARYRHGEAVGLGLLVALRLSGLAELRTLVRELLCAHELPVTLRDVDVEDVLAATVRDKKRLRADARVPFVLLAAPGEPRIGCAIPDGELRAAVAELTR